MLFVGFASVENQAFGEEFVEEAIKQAYRFAVVVYVPDQEFVVQRRDKCLFILYSEQRT